MTRYEIRLDELGGANNSTSSSTVIVGEDTDGDRSSRRQINWGNASHRGETRPIVVVKLGFLEITVDEFVVGKDKMRALYDAYHRGVKPDARLLEATTSEDRRDAATAAADAKHYDMSATIEPAVLFDLVVVEVLSRLADAMNSHHLSGILNATLKAIAEASQDGYREGTDDTKAEFRRWLGISSGGCRCSCGPQP